MQCCATAIFVLAQPVMVCAGFELPFIKLATHFVGKFHNGLHTGNCCKFGDCLIGHLASKTYEGV
jgi:TRAP-type C4-dicarboxylate transport system permease large subunit